MGGRLVRSVTVAASYQGSGGGGVRQYDTRYDHHRLGPAVNKMTKKKKKKKAGHVCKSIDHQSGDTWAIQDHRRTA